MRQYINILFAAILAMFISGCINQSVTITPDEQAVSLRNAINTNDFILLSNSITLPLALSKQDWETANDGYGYVLGAKYTQIAKNTKDLDEVFRVLEHVEIEGEYSLEQEFTHTDFRDEFAGIDYDWGSLKLVVFFRGQGDVEHIVVLGLDKTTSKLRAIYIN